MSSGLPTGWWKRQEAALVSIVPEKQGFLLNRYTVYLVQTDVSLLLPLVHSLHYYDFQNKLTDLNNFHASTARSRSATKVFGIRMALGLFDSPIPV